MLEVAKWATQAGWLTGQNGLGWVEPQPLFVHFLTLKLTISAIAMITDYIIKLK